MAYKIYHNPRCSKSRQTLEILHQKDVEPDVVEYLKTPPSVQEMNDILKALGKRPREILRTGEDEYKAAGLEDMSLSDEEIISRMIAHPKVIERPIVIRDGKKGVLGRPPEAVEELF